ncbi:MAG: hypothetical protein ACPGED_12350 [Flavobacteriales bacterium]
MKIITLPKMKWPNYFKVYADIFGIPFQLNTMMTFVRKTEAGFDVEHKVGY